MRLRNSTRTSSVNSSVTSSVAETIPVPAEPILPTVDTVLDEVPVNDNENVEQVNLDEDSDTGSDVFMPVGITMKSPEISDNDEDKEDSDNEDEDEQDEEELENEGEPEEEKQDSDVSLPHLDGIDHYSECDINLDNSKDLDVSNKNGNYEICSSILDHLSETETDPYLDKQDNSNSNYKKVELEPIDNKEKTENYIEDKCRKNGNSDISNHNNNNNSKQKLEEINNKKNEHLTEKDIFTEGNIFSKPDIFYENHNKSNDSVEMEEQQEDSEQNISDDFMIGHSQNDEENEGPPNPPAFEITETNIYIIDKKKSRSGKDIRRMICECPFEPDDPLYIGCDEDCLNRLLMIECNKHCPTGEFCTNKGFQKGCIYDLEIIKAGKKGWGLKSNETISKGAFVIEYCGEVVDYNAFHLRTQEYHNEGIKHYYFMTLKTNEIIDATKKGSISRFINHSCDPNSVTQKWTVNGFLRVGFFALRHIKPGEELSFDYQFQRYGEKPQPCYCGASNCRGVIGTEQIATIPSYIEKYMTNSSTKKKGKGGKESKKPLKEFYDSALAEDLNVLLGDKWVLTEPKQTLELVRLMVKTETSHERRELLKIIKASADSSALKSFVRYKGLDLLWSWMIDASSENRNKYRFEILKTLKHIPIRNKNELDDSKLLSIVSKWAIPAVDSTSENQSDDDNHSAVSDADVRNDGASTSQDDSSKEEEGESYKRKSLAESMEEGEILDDDETVNKKLKRKNKAKKKVSSDKVKKRERESMRKRDVSSLAQQLLDDWKLLKEVFRIPKKSRTPDRRQTESDGSPKTDEKRLKDKTANISPHQKSDLSAAESPSNKPTQPDSTYSSPMAKQKQIRMHKGLASFMARVTEDNNDLTSSSEEQSSTTFDENSDHTFGRNRKVMKRDWPEPLMKRNNRPCDDQSDFSEQSGTIDSTSNWSGDSSYENFQGHRKMDDGRRMKRGKDRRRSYEDDRRKWNEYNNPEERVESDNDRSRSWDERRNKPMRNRNWNVNRGGGRQNRDPGTRGNYDGPDDAHLSWRNRNNDFWAPQPPPPKPQPPPPQPPQPPQPAQFSDIPTSQHMSPGIPSLMDQEFDQSCNSMPNQHIQRPIFPPNVNSTNILTQPRPPNIMAPQIPNNMMLPNCPPPYLLPPPPMPPHPMNSVLTPRMNTLLPNQIQSNSPLLSPMSNQPYNPPGTVTIVTSEMNQSYPQNSSVYHGPAPTEVNALNVVNQLQLLLNSDRHSTPDFNRSSTNTSPIQSTSSSPSRSKPVPALPPNWKTATDSDGRVYYYHSITRETSWDPPMKSDENDVLSSPTSIRIKNKNSSEGLYTSPQKLSPRIVAADTTHHQGPRTPPVPQSSSKVMSSVELQKIRETFKSKMSSVVVNCLNSYQKVDCKQGRIKNTDDFKFLARKLTHGLIMKEIQRIKNEELLVCNDSVKVKVKEYIRNYMKKFGLCYIRS